MLAPTIGGPGSVEDAANLTALPGMGYTIVVQFGVGEAAKSYLVALKENGTATAVVDGK